MSGISGQYQVAPRLARGYIRPGFSSRTITNKTKRVVDRQNLDGSLTRIFRVTSTEYKMDKVTKVFSLVTSIYDEDYDKPDPIPEIQQAKFPSSGSPPASKLSLKVENSRVPTLTIIDKEEGFASLVTELFINIEKEPTPPPASIEKEPTPPPASIEKEPTPPPASIEKEPTPPPARGAIEARMVSSVSSQSASSGPKAAAAAPTVLEEAADLGMLPVSKSGSQAGSRSQVTVPPVPQQRPVLTGDSLIISRLPFHTCIAESSARDYLVPRDGSDPAINGSIVLRTSVRNQCICVTKKINDSIDGIKNYEIRDTPLVALFNKFDFSNIIASTEVIEALEKGRELSSDSPDQIRTFLNSAPEGTTRVAKTGTDNLFKVNIYTLFIKMDNWIQEITFDNVSYCCEFWKAQKYIQSHTNDPGIKDVLGIAAGETGYLNNVTMKRHSSGKIAVILDPPESSSLPIKEVLVERSQILEWANRLQRESKKEHKKAEAH